ncbi:MAG TPA: hypothetical protein VM553_14805 [Dongiaceae bacterium]|nr:hypothetical protein [Dongiaceae bacterium]
MMQETQRLAYLNALGITQYVPLAPIAGAPVLPVLQEADWAADIASDRVEEAATQAIADYAAVDDRVSVAAPINAAESTTSFAQEPSFQTILTQAISTQTPSSPQSATPTQPAATTDIPVLDLSKVKPESVAKAAPPKAAATALRFALAVVTLPQRLRLIVELAQPDAPGFSAREHRIISDLLLALDPGFELHDSATKLFRWPLVNNPRIAADAGAARDALFAFLAGAQDAVVVPATVFLGSAAVQHCVQNVTQGESFQLADIPGDCLATHSLRELDQDWRLKPVVWAHLLALLPKPLLPESLLPESPLPRD